MSCSIDEDCYQSNSELAQDVTDFTVSVVICAAMYATHIILASCTLYTLYHGNGRQRRKLSLLVSSFILLGTVNFSAFARIMLDSMRSAISKELASAAAFGPLHMRPSSASVEIPALMILVLSEGYMLYRCSLIWGRNFWVMIPLSFFYVTLIFWGVIAEILSAGNASSVGQLLRTQRVSDMNFSFIFWITGLSFNMTVTILITARLLYLRHKTITALGKQYGKGYTFIVAVVVESAVIYDVFVSVGYLFLPTEQRIGSMFTPAIAQVQCIATELIILRFSLGQSWSDDATSAIQESQQTTPEIRDGPKEEGSPADPGVSTRATSRFPSSVAAVLRSYDSRAR
jgi:hypothetical protein